ncbi:unnamed protein product [Absidia cylindrospora]
MNYRDPLPAEIISLIVEQLHVKDLQACTLVNWWFHTITNPVLWRTVTLRQEVQLTRFVSGLLASPPEKALGKCSNIFTFMFHENGYLLLLTEYLPLLKTLELGTPNGITNVSIPDLAESCPLIQSLSISYSSITDQALVAISQHYPHLTCLVLEHCRYLTPKHGAFGSLQACTSLRNLTLDIGSFLRFSNMTFRLIGDLLTLSSLTQLALLGCPQDFAITLLKYTNNTIATTNPTLTAAAGSCWPDLNEFSLDACHGVDDKLVANFLQTHPKLVKLTLDKNNFTDGFLGMIPNYLPCIESLSLAGAPKLSAKGVRQLVLDCPALSYLNIKGCENIRDDAFPEADFFCVGSLKEVRGQDDDSDDYDDQGGYLDDYYDADLGGYRSHHSDDNDDAHCEQFLMRLYHDNIACIRQNGMDQESSSNRGRS